MIKAPLETVEQKTLARYLKLKGYRFYKSPSETYTTSWKQKAKNKAEWVTKWFPDTVIILKRWSLLFIELKRQWNLLNNWKIGASSSTTSPEQLLWKNDLNAILNVQCNICYWAQEAIDLIEKLEKEIT